MSSVGWLEFVASRLAIISICVSCVALMLGWRRRERILARQAALTFVTPLSRFELARTPFASGLLDVATELRAILAHAAPSAAENLVQLELAVQPDLMVRADQRALHQALGDLVSNAIRHAPCGRVLVGAMRYGGRVQISVTDDGAGVAEAAQEAVLRDAERLVALQGGTVEIEAHGRESGSTVLLRLPEPAPVRPATDAAPPAIQAPPAAADVASIVWTG